MYEYRAKLLRVVDGDTVHLEIDLGLETLRKINCRVYGINAPEMNTPEGKAAKIYLAGLLAPDADNLLVRTFKDRTEKYGRYLVRIETTHGSAAAAMVAAGHAVRFMVKDAEDI